MARAARRERARGARRLRPTAANPPERRVPRVLVWGPALALGLLLIYYPAWHGGPVWDDAGHLTRPGLQSLAGLGQIWFKVGATQQYYPVVHSAFWLMHRLWDDDTLGYHLVTILLHATTAILAGLILRRNGVPGAALAAVIFAVHPVQVESVAWMSELKNTLSGVFAASSVLAYLRFDRTRARGAYLAAAGLFVLALLSKSVTATLPLALLTILWWERGRLGWKDDIRPLVPFAIAAVGVGTATAWFEQALIGARGAPYELSLAARAIVAGRAVWFYLGELVRPAHLTFIYPRWAIDPHDVWQYLPLVGVALLVAGAWALRSWSRGPLAALVYFVVTLGPALGFVNVFPFKYSFVADHFQYLACLGPIALFAAGVATLAARRAFHWLEPALIVLLGAPLAFASWRLSHEYRDIETLYEVTLEKNPQCWLCSNNLGLLELDSTPPRLEAAATHFAEAVTARPDLPQPHEDLGVALDRLGRRDAAAREFETVLRITPGNADVENNLGSTLQQLGRLPEAASHLRRAVALRPDFADAHDNLGIVLFKLGDTAGGVAEYRTVVRLRPSDPAAHAHLATALDSLGHLDEALPEYEAATRTSGGAPGALAALGQAELRLGRFTDAVRDLRGAVTHDPYVADWHNALGVALANLHDFDAAIPEFRAALAIDPTMADAHGNLDRALRHGGGRP